MGLLIVQDWKNNMYLRPDKIETFEEYVKKETGMSVAEIEKLTKGKTANLKVQLSKYNKPSTPAEQLEILKADHRRDNHYNSAMAAGLEAIKKKDGKLAWEVINSLGDGEYMKVNKSTFDNVKY